LEADKDRMRDFVVDTREMRVLTSGGRTEVVLPGVEELAPSDYFLRQLGGDLGIRADLFDRLRAKHPAQFDHLVNGLLDRWDADHDGKAGRRLVRTYVDGGPDGQGVARAVLSDQFRRIDNYDIAMAALPIVGGIPNATVQSCDVTERKMYLKIVAPMTQVDLQDLIDPHVHTFLPDGNPDYVQAGFVISNSEVGAGALSIDEMLYRLVCTNGLIRSTALRRTHLGARLTADEDGIAFREETLAADDRALMMKVQDAVASVVDDVRFRQLATQFAEAATGVKIAQPVAAMKVLAPTIGLSEAESGNVLQHLIAGGDLSRFGLVNAITRASQDQESYDRATELEVLGGKILAYAPRDWATLALVG
jgi:hypothetical protein